MEAAPIPLFKAAVSDLSSALETFLCERSTGSGTSSKLEVSSFSSSEFVSSLSANLDAKLTIELVCSFKDGGGPRNIDGGCEASLVGSVFFFIGGGG